MNDICIIIFWITFWNNYYFFPLLLGQKYERENIMYVGDREICLESYRKMIVQISFLKLKT